MSTSANDPNWFWDGQRWLWWNGHAWEIPSEPAVAAAAPVEAAPLPPPIPPEPAASPAAQVGFGPANPPAMPPGGGGRSGFGKGWLITIIVVCVVLVLALIGGGAFILTHRQDQPAASTEVVNVQTEPLSTATDPFTPPAAPAGKASTDTPVAPGETPSAVRVKGGKAGLYGGTLDSSQCDKNKLVDFLEANPDTRKMPYRAMP